MDELTLHRYLDGRLDEQQRVAVEAALRADPTARRTLEALREEANLLGAAMEAQIEPASGAGRIGARVLATLHLEERSRVATLRTRKLFRRAFAVASFAAALALCFLLVRPRTPAGLFLSGTHATLTVHGEKREAEKGVHVYDGDGISTEKGQFVRLGLSGSQVIDIDEASELSIAKNGTPTILRMSHGRIGVTVAENQAPVQLDLPQGSVTVQPGARADIWLPVATASRWPQIFYEIQPRRMPAAVSAKDAPAIVTVFAGYAQIECLASSASLAAHSGVRAQFTKTSIAPRLVNIAGSRVLDIRGDDGLHTRENSAPTEWVLFGLMDKPQFETLGRRWGLTAAESTGSARIQDSLQQLDTASKVAGHAARAEQLAAGLQSFRQACETLAQNDDRRRFALTLEGLAHFEQGCARLAAGGRKESDPQVSFEAARVAFDAALDRHLDSNGVATDKSSEWRSALTRTQVTPSFSSLAPEAQAAMMASFGRAITLAWTAKVMPSSFTVLELPAADTDTTDKNNPVHMAAESFAEIHDDLGHSVESLAWLLGEALCDLRASDPASRHHALDTLHVLVSKPIVGTDGSAREMVEGIREAALIELVRVNANGLDAQKTLDALHDYELVFPLDGGAVATSTVRELALKGIERQKAAAFKEKRFDSALEACDALIAAKDEADGHWLDAGQNNTPGGVRHVGERLDRLEALVGMGDWVRAGAEAHLLNGNLPEELQPRYSALQAQIKSRQD